MIEVILYSALWRVVRMGLRTYLPTLLAISRALCAYIRRHEDKIRSNLGAENEAALDALLVACDVLEAILESLISTGS